MGDHVAGLGFTGPRRAFELRAMAWQPPVFQKLAVARGPPGRQLHLLLDQGSAKHASGKLEFMGLIEIVLIVLLVLVLLAAFGYGGGAYRTPGIGLGGILLIIVLILLLT